MGALPCSRTPLAPHCLEVGHALNLEPQSGLPSLPTSPPLDFTSHASQPLPPRFPLPGAPSRLSQGTHGICSRMVSTLLPGLGPPGTNAL